MIESHLLRGILELGQCARHGGARIRCPNTPLAAPDDAVAAGIYFLAAYCMLALNFTPFATAAALKISNE